MKNFETHLSATVKKIVIRTSLWSS